jgi:hypothetical protein
LHDLIIPHDLLGKYSEHFFCLCRYRQLTYSE